MKLQVKLKPFIVPNFVNIDMPPCKREDGFKELPSFPLSALSPEALEELCIAFRLAVFEKAGKRDPEFDRPQQGCTCK